MRTAIAMEGAGGSSMPSAWRFGVDAASVDIEPCESESWTITQDTMLAFQRLAQSACHGLARKTIPHPVCANNAQSVDRSVGWPRFRVL